MRRIILSLLAFILMQCIVVAQGEIKEDDGVFIDNERTLGAYLNSNGWGGDVRFGKRLDGFRKRIIEIGFSYIKHPKEIKSSHYSNENKSYVFGKLNYLITLNGGYGRQREVFSKYDKGGIAIRYFYTGGIVLGLLKPIYYEARYQQPDNSYYSINEKFDKAKHHSTDDIISKAPFTEGLGETKLVPAIYIKAGINFEFSKTSRMINALEAGAKFELYLKKMKIMDSDDEQRIYFCLFISYRFGKIFSPRLKNVKDLEDL